MANEKPFVQVATFETSVAYQYDAGGKIIRDENGKAKYLTKKFIIQAEYADAEEVVKAAVKYTVWRAQSKVRAHYWANKKGKTTPYGLQPGVLRRVDPEAAILKDLDDEIAELRKVLEAKLALKETRDKENEAKIAAAESQDVDEINEESTEN